MCYLRAVCVCSRLQTPTDAVHVFGHTHTIITESKSRTFTQRCRPYSLPETATRRDQHLMRLATGNCNLKRSQIPKEKNPENIYIDYERYL